MTDRTAMTPAEFGKALREARVAAGVSLETICERTKIGRRTLDAMEAGEFEKLPDKVFVRLFLQQVVDLVGGDRATWLEWFDGAWERYVRGSQQFRLPLRQEVPPRRPVGPWIVGIVLAAVAMSAVLVLQHRQSADVAADMPAPIAPTPFQMPPAESVPEPGEGAATPAPVGTELPGGADVGPAEPPPDLVFATAAAECWVQVAVAGGATASRLLPPQSRWEVSTGAAAADIVIGAAGAVVVTFRGQEVPVAGRPGSVVRLRVPPPGEG